MRLALTFVLTLGLVAGLAVAALVLGVAVVLVLVLRVGTCLHQAMMQVDGPVDHAAVLVLGVGEDLQCAAIRHEGQVSPFVAV